MRFTLYTEKTVPQSLSALNARLQAKETASRPELDGWIERGGDFSLQVTIPVLGKLARTTRLNGHIERQPGITVVRGNVPGGSGPRERVVALGALAGMGLLIAVAGSPLLTLLLVPVGLMLYIPMAGDYVHGPLLVSEVQRTLKAKATPPKTAKPAAGTASRSSTSTRAAPKPARPASKPASRPAPKPAARPAPDEDEEDANVVIPVDEDSQPRLL
ncbi:MAG TPA: hypothetical protein VER79_00370 [Candidatus Limnocylindrales bacterium]|nr:hypothetical protein [Candidatus Limnocylindrales bacterium]